MRIGQILLARGRTGRDALERAWSLKVLFGDRLGTNLLAEALVDEEELALALGEQANVRAAWGSNIQIDKRTARRIPANMATELGVVPHHQSGTKIYVLMRDPQDTHALGTLRGRLDTDIVPVVVAEARLWKCLFDVYGKSPGFRPIPLDEDVRLFQAMRGRQADDTASPAAATGPELTTEADFQDLYMRPDVDDTGASWAALDGEGAVNPYDARHAETNDETGAAPSASRSEGTDNPFDDSDDTAVSSDHVSSEAILLTSVVEEAQGVYLDVSEEQDATLSDGDTGEFRIAPTTNFGAPILGGGTPAATAVVEDVLGMHTAPKRDLDPLSDDPLTFAEADALLKRAHHRDDIAEIVLRAALTRFSRAALLTVHPGMVLGWKGRGEQLSDALLQGYRCLLSDRHVFSLVVKNRAQFIGPLERWAAHAGWVKHTHRKIPRSVAVFPVLVRGHVVNLLYGDNGHDAYADSDVGELLVLAQRIAQSYETMLSS